jgi:hypothetical protein
VLSDLLASVAPGGTILVSGEDYLLARVQLDGREMLAEISIGNAGGIRPGEWPKVRGVLLPDSTICPENQKDTRVLLFSIPEGGRLLLERLIAGGPMSEADAAAMGIGVLEVLRKLHQEGARVGYLGPENVVLTPGGSPLILGGARGVPDSPFSPPEAVGRSPEDPRSDIFALGLLMFRAIAGSDSREKQIDAWNTLSEQLAGILEGMVAPDPANRFPNLAALSMEFGHIRSTPPVDDGPEWMLPGSRAKRMHWAAWLLPALLAAAALVYFLFLRQPGGERSGSERDSSPAPIAPDSALTTTADSIAANVSDTLPAQAAAPIIWVSNGTGQTGAATAFREGPAAEISGVYTCTAGSRRSSLLLIRRDDPSLPLASQERLLPYVEQLSGQDSSMQVSPVDFTIMLGSDIQGGGVLPGPLLTVPDPAGTLYVDIANHGVGADFGGAGAATWTRSILHGGCVSIGGSPWVLQVVDIRDGDLHNPELGIPTMLDSTVLLYRRGNTLLDEAARSIRQAILSDSTLSDHPSWLPDPPDIWVLLGS